MALFLLLVLVAALGPAGVANAAPPSSVVMYSDPGEFIGRGQPRLYRGEQVSLMNETRWVDVVVRGGSPGDDFELELGAPTGEKLRRGWYTNAVSGGSWNGSGKPLLEIYGDGRGCFVRESRFEVRDIAFGPRGEVERLWVVFEQRCGGAPPGLFGEIRVGVPAADADPLLPVSTVRWPEVDIDRGGTAVPVTVLADGRDLDIAGAAVRGPDASVFPVTRDGCSGRRVPAGGTCEIWLRFLPAAPGSRSAALAITEATGARHEIALEGFANDGRTRFDLDSEPGDFVGQGRSYRYTLANADIRGGGSAEKLSFAVDAPGPNWFDAVFEAPKGEVLVAGRRYVASTYPHPFSRPDAGMSVDGNGRGCNRIRGEFTVTDISLDADGWVTSGGVSFEQRCEGGEPALRGTLEFRAGKTLYRGLPGTPVSPLPGESPASPGSTLASAPPAGVPGPPALGGPASDARLVSAREPCRGRRFRSNLVLRGLRAAETLRGGERSELVLAGSGNDRVLAGGGADCVAGGPGRDLLSGGAGNDVLDGQAGQDRLDCGPGRDTAWVGPGDRVVNCERMIRPGRP